MTWDEDRQEFICPECESKVWNDVRFIYMDCGYESRDLKLKEY